MKHALFASMPFDGVKDFSPIALLAYVTNTMVVHPSVPALWDAASSPFGVSGRGTKAISSGIALVTPTGLALEATVDDRATIRPSYHRPSANVSGTAVRDRDPPICDYLQKVGRSIWHRRHERPQ